LKPRLLKWLACPICHNDLKLVIAECRTQSIGTVDLRVLAAVQEIDSYDDIARDVVTGALTCNTCGVYYPIQDSVPRILIYRTDIAVVHAQENASWIATYLKGFELPDCEASPGETIVLRNFSREWTEYKWSGQSYWDTTPETMLSRKRYELGVARHPLQRKLVLEVGIGIGGTAHMISRSEGCELVGMDLGYGVDRAHTYFGTNPRLHIIQASVFAAPFRPGTFDTVYSHGVIHHTYSTHDAFTRIAHLPKVNGMLYVWVYSTAQEKANPLRKALMVVEALVRPALSRMPNLIQKVFLLPIIPFYWLYQNLYRRNTAGGSSVARYGWNEALHAARDRLTPPFAFRHTYEEVVGWFENEGYGSLELLRDESRPASIPEVYQLNVGIRGFRKSGV
jgi:uncharacterized protein YbaR (Trm112 family)/SAM-dependent methyltransferase